MAYGIKIVKDKVKVNAAKEKRELIKRALEDRYDEWERLRRLFGESKIRLGNGYDFGWKDYRGMLQSSDVKVLWDLYTDAIIDGKVDKRVANESDWKKLDYDTRIAILSDSVAFDSWLLGRGNDRRSKDARATIKAARDESDQRRFKELFEIYLKENATDHWDLLRKRTWMIAALGPLTTTESPKVSPKDVVKAPKDVVKAPKDVVKAPKDVAKRKPTAYNVFIKTKLPDIHKANPESSKNDNMKKAIAIWHAMSNDEKKLFATTN